MPAVKEALRCPHCKHDWMYGWTLWSLIDYLEKGISKKGMKFHTVKCVRCTYEYEVNEIMKLLKGI